MDTFTPQSGVGDIVPEKESSQHPPKPALKVSTRPTSEVPLSQGSGLGSGERNSTDYGGEMGPQSNSPSKIVSPRTVESNRRRRGSYQSTIMQVDLPVRFQRVINYIIDSSPPGQLPIVIKSCHEILLRALSTIDTSGYLAAISQAADRACLSRAEKFVEKELLVVRLPKDDEEENENEGQDELKKHWGHTAFVISGNIRGQTHKTPYWYIFDEGRYAFQIDPIRRLITNVVPLSSSLDWISPYEISSLDHPHRIAVECALRSIYLPQHYPALHNVALSVHLSQTSSFFPTTGEDDNELQKSQSASSTSTPFSSEATSRHPSIVPSLENGFIRMQIIIAVEDINTTNFWSGSWKSIWEVEFQPNVEKTATIKARLHYFSSATIYHSRFSEGRLKVMLQYTEDGSICVREQSNVLIRNIEHTIDPDMFARDVTKVISQEERILHNALKNMYLALHVEVLRSLRRLVPIAGCRFNWSGGHETMTRDISNISFTRKWRRASVESGKEY